MSTQDDTGDNHEETLTEALDILNEDEPELSEQKKEAEATEEVGTVLGDLA